MKPELTKFERIMKGRIILSGKNKDAIWKLIRDPEFDELKEPRDHGKLWFKCSGAYA